MHEFSIVSAIMEQVMDLAQKHNARIVTEVQLDVGQLKQIVSEVMQTAWESATKETLAEGSILIMTEIPIIVKCKSCGQSWQAEVDDFMCKQCQVVDMDLISGDEIILKSVSLENDE